MPDTPRTLAALQALLADNTSAAISPQDIRDFLVSVFPQTTKGDLAGIDAAGIIGRLPATTDGFVLTLDATQTYGFKWAAAGSGAVATDTIWDAAGDLAVGTGADTAARLAISVPAADIVNVPGVVNGESTLSYKSLMDATAPTTQAFGDAAAAGTGVMLARVTHKHAMPANPVTAHEAAYAHGDIAGHIADAADAHDASAISILDTATQYTATDVEGALAEVLDALQAHEADTTDAHDASAISNVPAGTVAATTVQAAIDELATDYAAADTTHAGAADPHTGYVQEAAASPITFPEAAAPGTPAADSVVLYNETNTDQLRTKDDTGAVWNLMAKRVIKGWVDCGIASTTVPYSQMLVPFAGTITKVEVLTQELLDVTGSTLIVDIHKQLAADKNTTTTTTLYTTQANRPTVAVNDQYVNATLPDVLTVAEGDVLLFFNDDACTGARYADVFVTIRPTG